MNKIYYNESSPLKDLQISGNKYKGISYQEARRQSFSEVQNRLYRRALYGLSEYSQDELRRMTAFERQVVESRKTRVWKFLNKWKNEVLNSRVNSFLLAFFPEQTIAPMLRVDERDLYRPNNMSFTKLRISKEDIAMKLIELGFLPKNFFDLAA